MAKFTSGVTGIRQIIRGYTYANGSGAISVTIPVVQMNKALVNHNGVTLNSATSIDVALLLTAPNVLTIYTSTSIQVAYEIVEYF